MKKYRYVNPRAWFTPDWMQRIPSSFSIFGSNKPIDIPESDVWRNSDGKVMVMGFGITDEQGFNDAFEIIEE